MKKYRTDNNKITPYMHYLLELDEQGKLTPIQKKQVEKFQNIKKNLAVEPKMESCKDNFRHFKISNNQKVKPELTKSKESKESKRKGKEVPCSFCKKLKYVSPCELKYKWHFCNKKCQDNFYKGRRL